MTEQNEVQRAVEQLKKDGYQVEFLHWRQTFWNELARYGRRAKWINLVEPNDCLGYGEPMSRGGMTQCSILCPCPHNDTAELMTQAVTHCSKDDQFCYAQGRRISLARAIKDMEVNLPHLDRQVYDPLRGELWRNTRNGLR